MNAQERQLIDDLYARLRNVDVVDKDRDADLFIRDLIRRSPDAPYYLTQTVLVQQQALESAEARIRELEDTARRSQSDTRPDSGSFLSTSSVPRAGGDAASAPGRPSGDPVNEGPWASSGARQSDGRSGGFLASAISTATGVAGGMFLADGIRSLFGSVAGRSYAGSDSTLANAGDQAALDRAQDDAQDAGDDAEQARKDLAADDAALDDDQDADDDSWSDDDSSDA